MPRQLTHGISDNSRRGPEKMNVFFLAMSRPMLLLFLLITALQAQVDLWDLPPLRYSDTESTDRLAQLAKDWKSGKKRLEGKTEVARVKEILAALQVPESSQILVFSKTSKQNHLIHPGNPRALYFSRDCYCGFVPGGMMEVIIHDRFLGPVFYLIDLGHEQKAPKVERDTSDCLSCHGTGRTENAPGVLVRSVFPDENGHPLLSFGSGLVMHDTPIVERWGGYYVTGAIGLPHFGNRTYAEARQAQAESLEWISVNGKIDASKYPCATSDIVALMVLEHQCQAHNLLTAAKMNYDRARYLSLSIDPGGDPDQGSAGRVADQAAQRIVDWFLFSGETDMGDDGVSGSESFQQQFAATIPRAGNGDSLADFQLNSRLFKNRCSYMIYSEAFAGLPASVRKRVITRLKKVLETVEEADDRVPIKISERKRIAEILRDTGVF
jgi:hypothetical protein